MAAEQFKREIIHEAGDGVIEKITLDFNPGAIGELQDIITSGQSICAGASMAVVVETSNCTGIAGSIEVKQSMEKSGSPMFAGNVAATTLALAVTGSVAVGVAAHLELNLAYAVLDCTGVTWPSAGRMIIYIITKY